MAATVTADVNNTMQMLAPVPATCSCVNGVFATLVHNFSPQRSMTALLAIASTGAMHLLDLRNFILAHYASAVLSSN
jgi:hypothetical protein